MKRSQTGAAHASPGRASLRNIALPLATFVFGAVAAHACSDNSKASAGAEPKSALECPETKVIRELSPACSAAVDKLQRLPERATAQESEETESREPADSEESDVVERKKASKDLVAFLRKQTLMNDQMFGGQSPDLALSQFLPYVQGMSDALSKAGGDLAGELASDVEDTLCNKDASPTLKLAMLRITQGNPDLSSTRGLDCAVGDKRSVSLKMAAVDAWRTSGLPKSESLEALGASDPQMADRMEGKHRERSDPEEGPDENP